MVFTWIFGIILALTFIFLLVAFCVRMSSTIELPVAFAGHIHLGIPKDKEFLNLDLDGFRDVNGNTLDIEKSLCFSISGKSMLLAGIEDNDILFTDSVSPNSKITFPCVTVIKRDHTSQCDVFTQGNMPQYKVRRSWGEYEITSWDEHNILKVLDEISTMSEFVKLLEMSSSICLMDSKEMKQDFIERRWPAYKKNYPDCQQCNNINSRVVISTTLDIKENKVHFSIHPRRCLVGVATNSFSVPMAA